MRRRDRALMFPMVLLLTACVGTAELPWKPKEVADTIEDLSCPEWKVRIKAIRKVVGAGRCVVPFLLVALKNPQPLNRQEVAYCLGRIGDPVAVPSLIEVLQDDPPFDVIVYTVDALGSLGEASAVAALRPLRNYTPRKDEYGREIGPRERKAFNDQLATVRNAAATALARLGDPSGIPILIENLTGLGWVRRDSVLRLWRLTGGKVYFGFHLDMSRKALKKTQQAWFDWWEKNKKTFKPDYKATRKFLAEVYFPREKE